MHFMAGLLASMFLFFVIPVYANVQIEPGHNLTEKKVKWTWSTLPVVVKACRIQNTCMMTDAEKKILDKVISNLSFYNADSLEFKSEKENPGFFTSDQNEVHRLAITGNTAQSKIVLNSDRMPALNFQETLALLGHEIIHHVGILDEETRIPDQMGAKLSRYFIAHSISANLEEFNHREIQIFAFGVNVPESMEYFQIFPKSQRMLVAVMDSLNVYNIEKYDSDDQSLCLYKPDYQFINQNVRGTTIAVDRWFPGNTKVYLQFNFLTQNACRNTLDPLNADMIGVNLISQLSLQLDLLDPKSLQWSDSRLRINPNLLRTLAREAIPEEAGKQVQMARVQEILKSDAVIQAGQDWNFEAKISYTGEELKTQCAAAIQSESWHTLDFSGGLVPPFVTYNCSLSKMGVDQYLMKVQLKTGINTVAGSFKLNMMALFSNKSGGMISAYSQRPIEFQILNKQTLPAKILSANFVTANFLAQNVELKVDQINDYEVRIQNGAKIYDPFITFQLIDENGETMDIVGNMRGENPNAMFARPEYRMEGNVMVAKFKIQVPSQWGQRKLKALRLMTLQINFENLDEVFLDFRSNPQTYLIRGN